MALKKTLSLVLLATLVTGSCFAASSIPKSYVCPTSQPGHYHNGQQLKGGWYFWKDNHASGDFSKAVTNWRGQKVRNRGANKYGLICHNGGYGPWYGVWHGAAGHSCKAKGGGVFSCS